MASCGGGGLDKKYRMLHTSKQGNYSGEKLHRAQGGYVLMNYDINSHNNFFALSGHAILNIKFNKNIEISIPEGYSEAVVYLLS